MPKKCLPILAIVTAAVIWGISAPVIKAAEGQIPTFSLAFIRFLIAVSLITTIAVKKRWDLPIRLSDFKLFLFTGSTGIVGNIAFLFLGLKYTTALDYLTFSCIAPIFIAIAGFFFLKEPLTKVNLVGQMMALIGAIIIIGTPNGPASNRILGDALLLLSTVCWASSMIFAKELFHRYGSFIVTAFIFLTGLVAFAPLALIEFWQTPYWINQVDINHWVAAIFLGIFTSVIAYLAFEWGLRHSLASIAGLVEHFQLIAGTIAAILLVNEYITKWFVIGASLVLIGVLFATRHAHHFHKKHI
jgi:drug/metabolite transporter (DMT)-like permease